jgi:dihydropteroate synthase
VDTRRASVARAALAAGADIVNDVSALGDPEMAAVVRDAGAGLVLMHMRGEPATMQQAPQYGDVVEEVRAFLADRLAAAVSAGIAAERVVLDPGIGFGKTADHNVALLAATARLRAAGRPLLVGVSRKSTVGVLTGRPVGERLAGSLALLAYLALRGVEVLRVHDAGESFDAVRVLARMSEEERRDAVAR